MTWRERFRKYTQSERVRVEKLEQRMDTRDAEVNALFDKQDKRMGGIVEQCQGIVKQIVKQFTGNDK